MTLDVDWKSGRAIVDDDAYFGMPPQHGKVYPVSMPDDLKWWEPLVGLRSSKQAFLSDMSGIGSQAGLAITTPYCLVVLDGPPPLAPEVAIRLAGTNGVNYGLMTYDVEDFALEVARETRAEVFGAGADWVTCYSNTPFSNAWISRFGQLAPDGATPAGSVDHSLFVAQAKAGHVTLFWD